MKFQIFSERCCGSNFVEATIKLNIPDFPKTEAFGFKHWVHQNLINQDSFPNDIIFIIVNRNPFDFLRGIHRQPWHTAQHLRSLSFSDFIRTEWHCVWDEDAFIPKNDPKWGSEMMLERNPTNNHYRFRNILEVRNVKYAVWGEKCASNNANAIKVNFEQFLKSPSDHINRLNKILKRPDIQILQIPKGYKGNLSWKRKLALLCSLGLVGKYRKNRPRTPLDLEDIDFIHASLDPDLEKSWGYDIDSLAANERIFTKRAIAS